MAITFPANPSLNDTFTSGGKTFQWNGTSWTVNQEANILADTTPQLGGNLDLNSRDITGTGDINVTGTVTATSFSGDGSSLTGAGTTTTAEWTLGADGSNHYTFTGPGVTAGATDPTIYLTRGQTYKFKNRSGGHPFRIQTSFQNTSGTAYNDGIVNNAAGNGTDLYWEVRNDTPDTLYYQCTSHTNMSGRINMISGESKVVGLTSTTATARDAGITTATGSIIYVPDVGMQVYSGAEGGWKTVADTAAPPPDVNYFGNGSDGAFNSAGNVTLNVTNKNGSFDGDMMVKQYTSFTLNAGHTFTVDQPCRGLVILCAGDVSISGTLSMAHKGAYADAADNSTNPNANIITTVPANGLIWRFVRNGGGQGAFTPDATHLNGAAPPSGDIYTWLTQQNTLLSGKGGYEVRMSRQGAAGGDGAPGAPTQNENGQPGTNGTNNESSGLYTMQTGGGGGGGNGNWPGPNVPAGTGSYGSCFGGGSGGGGIRSYNPNAGHSAGIWGGPGGPGDDGGTFNYCGGGGAGNPGGNGNQNGGTANDGGAGTGGLIVIIAKGNVTVNNGGVIDVRGNAGGSASGHPDGNRVEAGGGGSGAGICLIAHGGTHTNSGTIHTAGGAGGVGSPSGGHSPATNTGGAGGTGSLRAIQIDV
jgi:hypothetical protein